MSNYMIQILLLLLKKKKKKIDSFDFWCFVVTFIDEVGICQFGLYSFNFGNADTKV